MFFSHSHRHKWVARVFSVTLAFTDASSALACGSPIGDVRVVEVTARLELKLEDGRSVRLAGLEAPSPEWALDRLAENWTDRPVRIALLAPRPDRWGRWLADLADRDGNWLTDDLIRVGSMRVVPEFETRNCEEQRLTIEQEARRRKLGLWGEAHPILDAQDLRGLADAESRFAIVEGRVRRVGEGRSRVYLDFGGWEGFTVVAPRKAEAGFQRRNMNLSSLSGHFIRVRGYLENRFAPRIELADPLMIERIEGVGGSGSGG